MPYVPECCKATLPLATGIDRDGPFRRYELPESGYFPERIADEGGWWAFTGHIDVEPVVAWRSLCFTRTRLAVTGDYRRQVEPCRPGH